MPGLEANTGVLAVARSQEFELCGKVDVPSACEEGAKFPLVQQHGITEGSLVKKKRQILGHVSVKVKKLKQGNDGHKSAGALRAPPGCHQPKALSVDTFWARLNRVVLYLMQNWAFGKRHLQQLSKDLAPLRHHCLCQCTRNIK